MRNTYTTIPFDFGRGSVDQMPKRVVLHRQGNPGATAINALNWGKRENAFTIHRYIEDAKVYTAVSLWAHAFHVLEPRIAESRGFRVDGAYGRRGDYDSIGIETVDIKGGAPGQTYSLSQETRISLVLYLRDVLGLFPALGVQDIYEHADFDTWTRSEDLGDALNITDLRLDVQDLIDGREPWRTVQQFAYGKPAPEAWRPVPPSTPKPPPVGTPAAKKAALAARLTEIANEHARQGERIAEAQRDLAAL